MKTVFLFPGQGSQKADMLKTFSLKDPIVMTVFSETADQLGLDVASLDTEEKLRSTVYAQVCLLIAGVISARQLQAKNIIADFVAGHSVGIYGAAVISGVLTFKQALSLVYTRGTLMEKAYPRDYGMAALVGISEPALRKVLDAFHTDHDTVYLANVNAPDQQVVAGKLASLKLLIEKLQQNGIRKAQLLDVAIPSHCPLLDTVSLALESQLRELDLREPLIPYASNHTGRLLRTMEAVRLDLYKSIASTVRWYDATTLLYELGGRIFIEMEPSGVLSKLAETNFPEAKVIALAGGDTDTPVWLWKSWQADNDTQHNKLNIN